MIQGLAKNLNFRIFLIHRSGASKILLLKPIGFEALTEIVMSLYMST